MAPARGIWEDVGMKSPRLHTARGSAMGSSLTGLARRPALPMLLLLLLAFGLISLGPRPGGVVAEQETETDSPRKRVERLHGALRGLWRNEREKSLKTLNELIPAVPAGSLQQYIARVLTGQITGESMAKRQAAWLEREVVDTVVLVPDEAAFMQAVGKWSAERFWPVLIEDAWYAPLFIEAFEPRRVVRWEPGDDGSAAGNGSRVERAERLAERMAAAIGEHNEGFGGSAPDAPGMVAIDPASPQRCGGLALALGRGQPAMILPAEASHRETVSAEHVEAMNERVMGAMRSYGLIDRGHLAGLTLAGPYPYRYEKPGGENPLGVDDRLGRDGRQIRCASVGRLIGKPIEAVYQAMAGLFLQPRRALMVSAYDYRPQKRADRMNFNTYHLNDAAARLRERLEEVELLQNEEDLLTPFLERTGPGHRFDLLWMHSSQGRRTLKMSGGPFRTRHMPVDRAMAAYMLASFSAADPWDAGTIAGRALRGGVYWYFGSMHEPYLQSFVPATEVAMRATPPTPLASAARQLPGYPYDQPWKQLLIGDPLFCLRAEPAERVGADALAGEPFAGAEAVRARPGAERSDFRRFVDRVLSGEGDAAGPAERLLRRPRRVRRDVLAQVVRVLYRQGKHGVLREISPEDVARHPVAAALVRRVRER